MFLVKFCSVYSCIIELISIVENIKHPKTMLLEYYKSIIIEICKLKAGICFK